MATYVAALDALYAETYSKTDEQSNKIIIDTWLLSTCKSIIGSNMNSS